MDQTGELARLRAELAALKLSISQNNSKPTESSKPVIPSQAVPTTKTALVENDPPDAQPISTSFAPVPGGLRGSRYAASAPAIAPVSRSPLADHDLATRGNVASAENSHQSSAASTSIPHPPRLNVSNIGGGVATGSPLTPFTNAQHHHSNRSLLGQDYKPPTKERIAKRGAVKIVPTSTPTTTAMTAATGKSMALGATAIHSKEHASVQAEDHNRKHADGNEAPADAHCRYYAEVKKVEEGPLQREKDAEEFAIHNAQAHGTSENMAIVARPSDGDIQTNKSFDAKKISSGSNGPDAVRNDFLVNSGRRICMSNLPSGANDKDIQELVEKKANAGQSIESITIFRRPNGQPGYALVDAAKDKDALHIVKWMTDERLFGWPVDMRMAHELSKEAVDKLLETGSSTLMLAHEKTSMDDSAGRTVTCRYWLLGDCRNGANCKFFHGLAGGGSPSDTMKYSNARRDGVQRAKRNYNFDNIPLRAEGPGEESGGSIFGTSVYRPTALRVITGEP
ncbi:hypothetical protein DBV05_g11273 [Lasiodiplodia theobromae]|uniref:C3H1-type domain-containing protein n=2 Tax=Lasiodiplodia theobromae TaxID=45133 RepID=A0A5N5CXG4_9PEZI|nr:hypothetical protein DBV05_g11273 [Lasiodiplodia theobromae]